MADYQVTFQALLDSAKIKGQIREITRPQKEIILKANGDQVTTTMRTLKDSTGQVYKTVQKTNTATKEATGSIETLSSATGHLSQKFTTILGKVIKFGAATAAIGAVTTAVYKSVQAISDYDNALTQYRKVSDLSGKSLQEYGVKLGQMGESVAKSRTQMIEAATLYKQAGYSDTDSATLAKISALYQNIADEELSASDASSVIVSQMKAFNFSAKDSIKIINSINEVGNEYAVSTGDIGRGLEAAGSAMSTYGNNFYNTIGLITAGTEIMQGKAGQVARGLNTIASRVTKNSSALAAYGIHIKDSNGNLRSTYSILSDLKPKWDKMSNSQKVALGNSLAG